MAKKILVVNDERHIVRLIQVNLERAGYEVVCAYDGVEALEKVKTDNPDMVILDILMPRMNGWKVLDTLRADRATKDLPIIILSRLAQDEHTRRVWGYQTKPFNPQELLTLIEKVFDSLEGPDDDEDIEDLLVPV